MMRRFSIASSAVASPEACRERRPSRFAVAGLLLAAAAVLAPATCHGQIAATVDASGRMTFVNSNPSGGSQKARSRSTISAPPAPVAPRSTPDVDRTPPPYVPAAAEKPKRVVEKLPPAIPSTADTESTGSFVKPPATESATDPMERIVRQAAERHKVDPALVKAVISTESGWNPNAISHKGAEGLMQLIPSTAERFGVGNPLDPAQNVEGGTTYLKWLLDRYNGDLRKTLAAYNAGEGAVDQHGGVPRYRETQQYVQKVTHAYFQPGSGRNATLWEPPRPPVRREVDANGRVVFTNE